MAKTSIKNGASSNHAQSPICFIFCFCEFVLKNQSTNQYCSFLFQTTIVAARTTAMNATGKTMSTTATPVAVAIIKYLLETQTLNNNAGGAGGTFWQGT